MGQYVNVLDCNKKNIGEMLNAFVHRANKRGVLEHTYEIAAEYAVFNVVFFRKTEKENVVWPEVEGFIVHVDLLHQFETLMCAYGIGFENGEENDNRKHV